jgi:hypothetical protein
MRELASCSHLSTGGAPGRKAFRNPKVKVAIATKGGSMNKLSLWKTIGLVILFCAMEAISSPAQTFTTLLVFTGTSSIGRYAAEGADAGSLVQGLDGNFYGQLLGAGPTATRPA